MTAQRGRDLLMKISDGVAGFQTVAGLRTRRLSLNADTVDITDSEAAGRWRQLLAGAGLRRAALSGSGIFKDQASDERLRSVFFSGAISDWQVIIPDFGTLTGPFQITALDYIGRHDSEVTFDLSMESAGELAFVVES